MLYIKSKFRVYSLIHMHQNGDFPILRESRPAEDGKDRIVFWGLKTGRKNGGRYSGARTVKIRWKTPHTLKHMLNLKVLSFDWYQICKTNLAQKASNQVWNIGNFTCNPMEGWFSGVRPYKTLCLKTPWCSKWAPGSADFH